MRASISVTGVDDPAEGMPIKGDWDVWLPVLGSIGYRGVELCLSHPQAPVEEIRELCELSRLEVSAISTGRAFAEFGMSLSDPEESLRWTAIERMKSFIELGAALSAPVTMGRICGEKKKSGGNEEALGRLQESAGLCASFARDLGVALLIVPGPGDERGMLNNAAQCVDLIETLGYGNLRIMLDAYCMYREEPDMAESVRLTGDLIEGFRLSDSNGGLPGQGKIDFAPVFRGLRDVGFEGFVTVKMEPEPSPKTVAEKAYKFLSNLVE